MRGTPYKPVLDKLDHRRVVHRRVRNIMAPGERRDNHVWQPEAKLRGEALYSWGVSRVRAGVNQTQVAMEGRRTAGWDTREIAIGIYGDLRDIRDRSQSGIGIIVRVAGHGRDMIVGASAFVVA